MRNKIKIAIGILTMAMLLGITVIGCNDDEPLNDPLLIGTWVATHSDLMHSTVRSYNEEEEEWEFEDEEWLEEWAEEVKFDDSNFESSIINGYSYALKKVTCPVTKGTYTTDSGIITLTYTHYYGEFFGLESRWYSKNEKSALVTVCKNLGLPDDMIELMLFKPQSGTYSVNGNTLNYQGQYYYKK